MCDIPDYFNDKNRQLAQEAKAQLTHLVAERERLARIDELRLNTSHETGEAGQIYMGRLQVTDRIAALQQDKEDG